MSNQKSSPFVDAASQQQGKFVVVSIPVTICLAIFAVLTTRFVVKRLQRAYGSSLRQVPGPWHAKFTDAALRYHDVVGDRFYWLTDLHKKYGPYVRTGPEEIAICDPAAVKKVHGLGTAFRKQLQPGTAFNIFSVSEPRLHRGRQRFYVNAFSNDKIKASHLPAVRTLCQHFIDGVREDASNNPGRIADMYKWCMLFGYDVASEVVFGNASTNGLMAQRKGVEEVMMGCYLQFQNAWMLFSFPSFLAARWLAPVVPWLGNTFATEKRYKHYKDLWEETERQRSIASKTTFVQGAQFDEKEGKYQLEGGLKMSAYDITRDITTFLGAGGEPIGATLVYLIYIVLQNTKLRQELEAEAKALQAHFTDVDVEEKCPLLDGTIYEALRLFGGGLSILPRYASTPQELGPYVVPPGTCVASHNHQLHRNPEAWDDPEA
ncbi:hypothetical protein PRZ48_007897 [Zasmidium cellare]|uniref:Cytochrome P450 n=1 Tax=Zasmidium cellare TaxID=395010 RepID=A0ABR0ELQ5_ZASCE|nr:hypothetical protein PRZ48_007897 [Zasmidium cellare]